MKKRSIFIALTALLSAGALLTSVTKQSSTVVHSVLATEEPEPEIEYAEEREAAKAAVDEMACVNEYSGDAKLELEAKILEVYQQIDNALDPHEIDYTVDDFRVYLEWYFFEKYHPTLSYYSNGIKYRIEYYSEDYSYDVTYQSILDELVQNALDNVDNATSIAEIDRIYEQFVKDFESFYRNYRVLEELKQEALDYIDWTLTKLSDYDEKYHSEIQESADNSILLINQATTNSAIYKEYDDYKDYFEDIPTLTEQELVRVKNELLSNMHILCTLGEMSLRNGYELDVFHTYYDWAMADIENATRVEDAYEYYEGFLEAAEELVPDIRERLELYKGGYKIDNPDDEDGQDDSDNKKDKNEKTGLIVACAVEGAVIVLGGALIGFYFLRNMKHKNV